MSFANLSPALAVAGLAGLAALLFALQILRLRNQRRVVPTMVFWRAAMESAPVRVFRRRFRHVLAYLLLLAIAALLWFAFAEPTAQEEDGDSFVYLLVDGSAALARGDRFDSAISALRRDAATLAADSRMAIWVGGENRTLLAPGESDLLLEARLRGLAPEAAPSRISDMLEMLAAQRRPGQDVQVRLYGAAPVDRAVLDRISAALDVVRAHPFQASRGNRGIVAVGASPSPDRADGVDILLAVDSDDGRTTVPEDIRLTLDGEALDAPIDPAGEGVFRVRGVPAQGGVLEASLPGGDALSLDDSARLSLPDRRPVRVLLDDRMPDAVAAALRADPLAEIVQDDGEIFVGRASVAPAGLPALIFGAEAEDAAAFTLTVPGQDAEADMGRAVDALGLQDLDASAIADAAEHTVSVSAETGDVRRLTAWDTLLAPEAGFVSSREFPVFMARAVRWLAARPAPPAYAAAGEKLLAEGPFVAPGGAQINPLGVPVTPAAAGDLARADGGVVAVSLTDPAATVEPPADSIPQAGGATSVLARAGDIVGWLLLAALLLLSLEWAALRTGRMP